MVEQTLVWISVIIAILFFVNTLIIIIARDKWLRFVRSFYDSWHQVILVFCASFAAVMLTLLLLDLKVTYIFAVMVFLRFVMVITTSSDPYLFIQLTSKLTSKKVDPATWFEIILWLALAGGTIYENWSLITNLWG